MKNHIKCMLLMVSILLLNGCMDTVSHFWNYGTKMSAKEDQAYDECFAEVRAADPVMAKDNKSQAELSEFLKRVRPCMERKGY